MPLGLDLEIHANFKHYTIVMLFLILADLKTFIDKHTSSNG